MKIFLANMVVLFVFTFLPSLNVFANPNPNAGFDIVALGTDGGLRNDNLTSFLIGPHGQDNSVACDAGSLISGIEAAIETGVFGSKMIPRDYPLSLAGYILREHIKGYLITHGHLDHIAGLIIASPEDSAKPLYGLMPVLKTIRETHFNWQSWPNFGDKGASPQLGNYTYINLSDANQLPLSNTPMTVSALPLSHNGIVSTAFVIQYKQDIVVCLGDTGPDSIEKSDKLKRVWQFIKPNINKGQLKAIIIESSFNNDRPDNKLFGHLTPRYINQELGILASMIDKPELLKDLPVIISHIKPSLKQGQNIHNLILEQLESGNDLGVNFIIPIQGQSWHVY